MAVLSDDNDAAAFLIGVNANLNSTTRNSDRFTPLHLAATRNSENICRSLVSSKAKRYLFIVHVFSGLKNVIYLFFSFKLEQTLMQLLELVRQLYI